MSGKEEFKKQEKIRDEEDSVLSEEFTKSLKGVFIFSTQDIEGVLGRDNLTGNYLNDICNECNVTGNINKEWKRMEITGGKREDVTKAIRKLKQLENNFLRNRFNRKRIPIVHHPNQTTLFDLYFGPLREHPYVSSMTKIVDDIYVLKSRVSDSNLQKDNYSDLPTPGKKLRDYNFNKMREFKEGLEYVRAQKGEIRFYGSLGKSLFTKVDENVKKSLWNYTDLEDVISRYGVKPGFNEIATRDYNLAVKVFTEILGSEPSSMPKYFEIKADARKALHSKFSNVYMYISAGHVSLDKVVLEWDPLVNIDCTVLDRELDFSMILATRCAVRHDVKPFRTFQKKFSVSPENKGITFEHVEGFLKVNSINFKQVSRFKLINSFVAELACVENVPLFESPNTNKILGKTGEGEMYFTLKIYNENHRKAFKQNASLGSGEIANWKVDDILGKEPNLNDLVEFVKMMLVLVERCHSIIALTEKQKE